MTRAIVTDLDDTLLSYDKTVSAFTKQTLRACRAKGIKTVFATARGMSAKDLVPFELFDGQILMNGALALAEDRIVYQRRIPAEVYLPFLLEMDALGLEAAAEIDGIHYANFDVASRWRRRFVRTDFRTLRAEAEKLYVPVPLPEQKELVKQRIPPELYGHFTKDDLALIMHREATKRQVLSAVLERWGIPFFDTVAFGDDVNDKEILQACGVGVAMQNALKEILEIADDICSDCDHDGVARWLSAHIV